MAETRDYICIGGPLDGQRLIANGRSYKVPVKADPDVVPDEGPPIAQSFLEYVRQNLDGPLGAVTVWVPYGQTVRETSARLVSFYGRLNKFLEPAHDTDATMARAAQFLDAIFNGDKLNEEREIGFALLAYPFNKPQASRMNYIGNGQEQDVLVAIKEMAAQWEGRSSTTSETMQ